MIYVVIVAPAMSCDSGATHHVTGNSVASVLTPYRSSDGNNPYTEAQLKALWKDLEPTAREPGKYTAEERILLQCEFLKYIKSGFTATRAVTRLQLLAKQDPSKWPFADYAVFMAWKAYDKDFADAYEVAYAMGTDELEDKGVDMAMGGNASMLQFLLKMRNATRYNPKVEHIGDPNRPVEHVHTIKLVAASVAQPQIVDQSRGAPGPGVRDYEDAEIVEDGG